MPKTNLATLLTDGVNGASFIAIDTLTNVKLKGGMKNDQQGRVQKQIIGSNVMVFQNKAVNGYDAMVKRRLEKEGKSADDFKLSPRQWGRRLSGAPFVEHKGGYYVEVIFLKAGKTKYLLDGKVVSEDKIVGLPPKKAEAEQGGLDDKVVIRTFKSDSIQAITINHNKYNDLEFNLPH